MVPAKSTPAERLRREIKTTTNNHPEVIVFKMKLRTVLPLMKHTENIIDFINGRRDSGLLSHPEVNRCAELIERYCYQIEDEKNGKGKEKVKPSGSNYNALLARSIEERNAIVPTGYQVKLSAAGRMAAAFDRIVGIDFASRDG